MRKNNFLENLQSNGASGCVMQVRKPHFLWAHDNRIYDKQIPNEFADEIIAAATRDKNYSRSPVLGLYINEKMRA
jgi:membrane carboxypeptidase/penicillin-binding protein